MNRLAAQIEETIAQADILGIFLFAEHRHRQFVGRSLHGDRIRDQLDIARRQILVHCLLIAGDNLAGYRDNRLNPCAVKHLEGLAAGFADNLGQTEMVAQIDKQQIAVIALAMDPAGQTDFLADVRRAKFGTIMGAICVHDGPLELGAFPYGKIAGVTQVCAPFVKA